MPRPEVWFAIPSANPEKCRRTLPKWREKGYKVAILQNHTRGDVPADLVVWSDTYPGWPESINILHREIVPKDAPIIVSGGDDMLPDPDHTAEELAEQFLERFPDGFGVMQPHGDTFMQARQYCGSPWLGRGFCRRMYRGSGPMFGGYRHNWADNELFWVAKGLGVLWERPDLSHFHEHFTRTGEAPPDYWTKAVATSDRADVQLFVARSWQHFPGHEPVGGAPVYDPGVFQRESRGLAEMYWLTRYGFAAGKGSPQERLHAALESCAARGLRRVAIYGGGTHTRAAAMCLMRPPVEIVAIIDDGPALRGSRMWNYPVVTGAEASALALDAVVLSSNSMEDELARAAEPLARAGVEVVRLYGEAAETVAA